MSHKIKILDDSQYSALLSAKEEGGNSNIDIYFASVLPGLFYSVKDLVIDRSNMKYIFIPPDELGNRYSPAVFDRIAFKKLELADQDIPIDDKVFIPILVENIVIGGFYGDYEYFGANKLGTLIESTGIQDYFSMIFNAAPPPEAAELSIHLLNRVAEAKSMDGFLRMLPEWIIDQIGGGQVGFYYRVGNEYHQRRIIGLLNDFGDMPAVIDSEEAKSIQQVLSEGWSFMPVGAIPAKASEILYPPRVRFIIEGGLDQNVRFIITGIIPSITDYTPALFVERLAHAVKGLSVKHFGRDVEWSRILAACDELLNNGKSYDDLSALLLKELNEYISLNRISLARYNVLENRIEINGSASLSGKIPIPSGTTYAVRGSELEQVIETGKFQSGELIPSSLDSKLQIQLYKEGVRSYIAIPIKAEGNIYGFINVGSSLPGDYLKRYINIFEALASYLGGFEQAKNFGRQLRVLNDQISQLEQKLSVIENLRTLGELAGGVFHDLNNAIGAILGRSQLIQTKAAKIEGSEIAEKIVKDAVVIEKSAVDSGEILARLRQLTKPGRQKKRQSIELNRLIDDSIEMIRPRWQSLSQAKGVKYTLNRDLKLDAMVDVDSSEIREVLTNILLNALDAMPNGGSIFISNRINGDSIVLFIRDTGAGMPADVLSKIFEPFFTTKGDAGTGLGLPLSKKIIENHGGNIKVNSEINVGTTFIITIPIARQQKPKDYEGFGDDLAGKGVSVLIVEDRPDFQEVMKEILVSSGLKTRTATTGEQAIQMCGSERFDIIITDLGLPGISGLELAEHIKQVDRRIKIILISGWEIEESIADLMKKGIDSLVTKPFRSETILDTIMTLLADRADHSVIT